MANQADAVVSISAKTDALAAGLQIAVGEVQGAAAQMQRALGGVAPSAYAGATAMSGFTSAIKEFKREQVQQGRLVGFYVREIADLAGAGKDAQNVMAGLGGVMAELAGGLSRGALIGAGIEGVKLVVGLVRQWANEAERAAAAWTNANVSVADFAARAEEQLNGMLLKARGFSDAMISAVRSMQQAKTIKLPTGEEVSANEAIVAAGTEIEKNKRTLARYTPDAVASLDPDSMQGREYAQAQQDIAKWEAFRKSLIDADAKLREVAQTVDRTEAKEKAASAAKSAEKRAEEAYAEHQRAGQAALDARARTFERQKKQEEDFAEWKRQFNAQVGDWEREDAAKEKKKNEEFAEWKRQFNAEVADWERENAKKEGEEIANSYVRPMVSTFSHGLAQMVQGQMSFRDFMRNLWSQLVSMIISKVGEMATKAVAAKITEANTTVSANAAEAASGAAASQASIPVVGPVLALGAMAAMLAAVMALKGNIGSAAGGWQLPSVGGPFPAILHPDEKVLNSRQSRTYDRLADELDRGGRVGGSGVTIHASFPSLDPATAARGFVRNEREIARTVKRAARRAGV